MKKNPLDKIIQMIREDVPTNAMAHGKIAGSAEAGDDPPVRKRKEIYLSVEGQYVKCGNLMEEEVKVAVLEARLENFETLVSRLDSAIEKIAEVNNNVSRMLAVHEERISKQEEIDEILFDKIDKLRDKMDSDHDIVTERLSLLERKLWIGIGAYWEQY